MEAGAPLGARGGGIGRGVVRLSARVPNVVLAVAVAIAFADSSIVVLALPQLYFDFHTTMFGVSWVITAYNLAVALTAFLLVLVLRRVSSLLLLRIGAVVFAAASALCAAAPELWVLILARCVQGVGAAAMLAAALSVFAGLNGDRARGAVWWVTAGTFGAAFGPALGGLLEQGFSWRAIFVVQAPVALAALGASLVRRAHRVVPVQESPHAHPSTAAAAGEVLGFGALVGALFLSVLLVTTAWGHSPLEGALIVSALPLATLAMRPVAKPLGGLGAILGAVLLAGGLVVLALLPAADVWVAVLALALCGAGMGLALPYVTGAALGDARPRRATLSVAWRHVGLVLGILVVTPLLVGRIDADAKQVKVVATAALLDAPVPLTKKVPFALKLRDAFSSVPKGTTPDLQGVFESVGGSGSQGILDAIGNRVADFFTRSFRASFLATALLGLALAIPVRFLRRRRG